jgi:hypothetical protein
MPVSAPRCLGSAAIVTHRFRRGLEQNVVDDRLVLQSDDGDRCGHGEHDVEIWNWQQLGLSVGEPLRAGQALAL